MRIILLAAACAMALVAASTAAEARLASRNYSKGVNAVAPSRAVMNPRTNFYRFGKHRRHR